MSKAREIFDAWSISFNPNQIQKKVAEDRFRICIDCKFKRELIKSQKWSLVCNSCGCPLTKKIYSNVPNSCPEGKWLVVDEKNGMNLKIKNNNSLI